VTGEPVTLLDINNTVPADMYKAEIDKKTPTPIRKSSWLPLRQHPHLPPDQGRDEVQLIMSRTQGEEVTRGTLEGDIIPARSPSTGCRATRTAS
jgi:hypothetical protein